MNFLESQTYSKLQELAKNPFDFTKEGNFTKKRISDFIASSCGYRFFYGTERVTDEVMEKLLDLAKELDVIKKMEEMQSGKICNKIIGFPSENRQVLHTATRDFFSPNEALEAKSAATLAKQEVDKLKDFIDKIEKDKTFNSLVMIGIGGSNLGPEAHYLALLPYKKENREVYFIGNIDPDETVEVFSKLDLSKTLVLIVSKSGSTLETAVNEAFAREFFEKKGLNPKEHFIAITGKGSPLDTKENYLESFYIWDFVGGRFSTSSMVGGVLLSFAFGFPVFFEFLRGCSAMDKEVFSFDLKKNLPLLGALLEIWNRNFLRCETLAIIPYAQALKRYPAHIQQVSMESNGKHIDQKGNIISFQTAPIIWGEPGTNAQHSFYQMIHQGTTVIPLEFIGFIKSQYQKDIEIQKTTSQQKLLANLFAQAISLAIGQKSDNPNKEFQGNRPSHILLGEELTPYSLGVLLAYFEHKVAFEGFLWGVNSFDQEGVQLGKVLANKIIESFAGNKGGFPLGDAFIEQL